MTNNKTLIEQAENVLRDNDKGGYTVPTHELYPFQWNWDAAITALGWFKFDEERAWLEIEMLLKGQWDNGMIPHIIFHQEVDSYFPGADVWGTTHSPRTTSISQPPVLASVILRLFKDSKNKTLALQKVAQIIPNLIQSHMWWYSDRDPENTGLVVSYHPWESGMDNSPAWDDSLAAVSPIEWKYERRDLNHVDSVQRPHQDEYDRYLSLVDFIKKQNFDSRRIFQSCPYRMNDVGIISILHKATLDLIELCHLINYETNEIDTLKQKMNKTKIAIAHLWNEESASFLNFDINANRHCSELTSGTLLAFYGELATGEQAEKMIHLLDNWLELSPYAIASTHPESNKYEPQRYWRGPVWLHINWLIALGVKHYQYDDRYQTILEKSLALIKEQGYYEYFNAKTGEGSGGGNFSWTAAISLYWLLTKNVKDSDLC